MKRCSPERRRKPAAATARRRRPVEAAAALGDGDGVEEVLLPKMAAGEEENSWYGALPTT